MCPAGHEAVSEYEDEEAPERVEMHFAREVCEPCSLRSRCPVRWRVALSSGESGRRVEPTC